MKRWLSAVNVLAVLAGLAIAVSLLYPWWGLKIGFMKMTYVYPYVIRGPATEVIGYRKTAQMPFLTGLLVFNIVLCFVGSVLRGRKGRIALGVSSLLTLVAIWRFYVRAASIAGRYHVPVQGEGIATYMAFSPLHVSARLQPGFYLVIAGTVLSLLAAILHDRLRLRFDQRPSQREA